MSAQQPAELRPVERLRSFLTERGLGTKDPELEKILTDLGIDDEPAGSESDQDAATPGPGPEYEPEETWAARKNITRRTVARYRGAPDGLPYLFWGNRIWIYTRLGEDFIRRRIKYPNRRRGRTRKIRDTAR